MAEEEVEEEIGIPLIDRLPVALAKFTQGKIPKGIVEDILEEYLSKIPKKAETVHHSPVDLKELYEEHVTTAGETSIVVTGIVDAAVIATALAVTTSIGDVLDEQLRIPLVAARIEDAIDILRAGYIYPYKPLIARYLMSTTTPLLPETYRLALARVKGVIEDDIYKTAMAESGLDSFWADVWVEENIAQWPLEIALTLWRRGIIKENEYHIGLKRLGYTDRQIEASKELKEVIPPLPDLIRFAVREAFGKHTYEEQYPHLLHWAGKMGLSKGFVDTYWYAHWDRIALTQCYDNLYRGFWSPEKFMDMLRIKDIHPDDRKAIFNVAYNPPSLREMGYGWDTGVYTEADILKFRKWGGLHPDDAVLAARSMVAYRTEAEREALRREHMHLFALGKETEEEFRANLDRLTTAAEAVELWVERGQLEAERKLKPEPGVEYRIVTSSEAKWAFVNNLRDVGWYRAKLEALDWEKERIDTAVERAEKEKAPEPFEPKKYTKSEAITLFKANIYDRAKFRDALKALNYADVNIAEQLKLREIEAAEEAAPEPPRPVTATEAKWHVLYGLKDAEWYAEKLKALNWSEERINVAVERVIKEKTLEPEVTYRIITASEAKWAFTYGLRDIDWYRRKLGALYWDEERINVAVERVQKEVELAEPEPEVPEERKLTLAQIRQFYINRQIDRVVLPRFIEAIGYSTVNAERFAELFDKEAQTEWVFKALSTSEATNLYGVHLVEHNEIEKSYKRMRHTDEHAKLLTIWARVKEVWPDLRAMYRNGWFSAADIAKRLRGLGLGQPQIDWLMMTFIKVEQPARVQKERDLTKSEIVKGVKAEILTPGQGVHLLMDLGYEEWEAWYILAVNKVVAAGDPEGYWEMKRVTEAYKKALGQPYKDVPEDLLIWEQRVKQLKQEKEKLEEEAEDEQKLAEVAIQLNETEANYRRLISEWERQE